LAAGTLKAYAPTVWPDTSITSTVLVAEGKDWPSSTPRSSGGKNAVHQLWPQSRRAVLRQRSTLGHALNVVGWWWVSQISVSVPAQFIQLAANRRGFGHVDQGDLAAGLPARSKVGIVARTGRGLSQDQKGMAAASGRWFLDLRITTG